MWWLALASLVVGALLGYSVAALRRALRSSVPDESNSAEVPATIDEPLTASVAIQPPQEAEPDDVLPPAVAELLRSLPGTVIVIDQTGQVVIASQQAFAMRLIKRSRISFDSVAECASLTAMKGEPQICEVTVRRPPLRRGELQLRVRGIPLPGQHVLLLLDDLTEEHRVATVRRDFIANVSHELKTPVGAVSLLSEALVAARDDPESVEHFANRLHAEAQRLTNLINDVIDLSRLQGDDPMSHASIVSVDDLVHSAQDFVRAAAEARGIELLTGGVRGEKVYGDASQLETALRNVLANAVVYSEPNTTVAVAVREDERLIEIDVKDQGIGIPEAELDRIFERFYRVDEARSRVTGGTGLGLSIVRNVCRNHGGDIKVWSVEGEGSTFTLQLPKYEPEIDDHSLATGPATEEN